MDLTQEQLLLPLSGDFRGLVRMPAEVSQLWSLGGLINESCISRKGSDHDMGSKKKKKKRDTWWGGDQYGFGSQVNIVGDSGSVNL